MMDPATRAELARELVHDYVKRQVSPGYKAMQDHIAECRRLHLIHNPPRPQPRRSGRIKRARNKR